MHAYLTSEHLQASKRMQAALRLEVLVDDGDREQDPSP